MISVVDFHVEYCALHPRSLIFISLTPKSMTSKKLLSSPQTPVVFPKAPKLSPKSLPKTLSLEKFDGATSAVVDVTYAPHSNARKRTFNEQFSMFYSLPDEVELHLLKELLIQRFKQYCIENNKVLHEKSVPTFHFMSGTNKKILR
ncbi:hypothetical protein P9112_009812 [Eukaryota sp. TZLM1-RC]